MMNDNGVVSSAALKLSYEWKPARHDLISLSPLNNKRVLLVSDSVKRYLKSRRKLSYALIELNVEAGYTANAFQRLGDALRGLEDEDE